MRIWDYTDEIHFIGMQLDYYYGVSNWPRRYCADIVGCSISTQRKYEQENWDLTKEEYDYINSLIDFSNREIKKLIYDDNKRYYAGLKNIIIKEVLVKTPEIQIENKPLLIKNDYKYKNGYPETSGLYMLGQVTAPANRPYEQYFLIKVGQSTNLKSRISSYKGMNPFACFIDISEYPSYDLNEYEIKWHNKLSELGGISASGTEWYVMPKNIYEKLIIYGFNYK